MRVMNKVYHVVSSGMGMMLILGSPNFLLNVSSSWGEPSAPQVKIVDKFSSAPLDREEESQRTDPALPPTNDPEMVIKPNVPTDPDAVVTPPVVDPEMAVDPASRQPLTPEKLEQLTPDELEKDFPDRKK